MVNKIHKGFHLEVKNPYIEEPENIDEDNLTGQNAEEIKKIKKDHKEKINTYEKKKKELKEIDTFNFNINICFKEIKQEIEELPFKEEEKRNIK